jgi:hypothetical protein
MAPALSKHAGSSSGSSAPATPPGKRPKLSERNLSKLHWPKGAHLYLVQKKEHNKSGKPLNFCGKLIAEHEEIGSEAMIFGIPSWSLATEICVQINKVALKITGASKSTIAETTVPAGAFLSLKIRRPRHAETGTCSIIVSLADVRVQQGIKEALNEFCTIVGTSYAGDYGGPLVNASRVNMQYGLIGHDDTGSKEYACVMTGEPGTFGTRTYGDIMSAHGGRFFKADDNSGMEAHWRVKDKTSINLIRDKMEICGCILSDVEVDEDAQEAWDNVEDFPTTADAPASAPESNE